MKRIIIVFLFMLVSLLNAQNMGGKNQDNKVSFNNIIVTISSASKMDSKNNIFDSDLILELGRLNPLAYLKVVSHNNFNELRLKLGFLNLESFYKWYNDENIKGILDKLKSQADKYSIELEYKAK